MQQHSKLLADQINKSLNDLGVSNNNHERVNILSKILSITKQQAWSLIDATVFPDEYLLEKISDELEINIPSKVI
ncbi:hypothetical protein N9L02_03275 [Gammaproteobacteria bacterium]|nr:hypothetical protein [Gammaproteobacteria bacterium]